MSITATTDLAPKVQAYYDRKFLLMAKPNMVISQFGQKGILPQGNGRTVYFTRYMPLEKRKTPLTETRDGGITNKKLKTQEISVTVAEYGDVVEISSLADKTHIDPGVKAKIPIVAQQAAETINSLINDIVGVGFLRRRADADTTYQYDGVATSAGTTTTLVDTSISGSDDKWNGGFVTFTNPLDPNYGITVKVSDYVASTHTLTIEALPVATSTLSKFRLVVGTGIVATDILSSAAIKLAVRDLKRNKAMPFSDGKYVGILDPDAEYDFMNDSEWKDVKKYQDQKAIYQGEVGEWYGVRFVQASEIYRETVAGAASETGAVHVISIIGQQAFGITDLEGDQKKIYVKNGKELGQELEMTGTVGWKVGFAAKTLNGVFGVNILCGATA